MLARGTWKIIQNTFLRVDLQWREDLSPGCGKDSYADRVLRDMEEPALLALAKRVIERTEADAAVRSIEDALWWIEDGVTQRISEVTRGELADAFDGRVLSPREPFDSFIKRLSGLAALDPAFSNCFVYSTEGRMCRGEGILTAYFLLEPTEPTYELSSHREALGKAGFFAWPDRRVLKLLEALVEPKLRLGEEQQEWVKLINQHIVIDGFRLEEVDKISGHPVFRTQPASRTVRGRPKNLIFASHQRGFKPILGLSDALDNDLVALKNEDTCLIYDQPIPDEGLTWERLAAWWATTQGIPNGDAARKSLGDRLRGALGSRMEEVVFAAYFRKMKDRLGGALPALLPQVYVHYDPRTRKERGSDRAFLVQRMDFLLLLPGRVRAVIEIDGKQHYSEERPLTEYDLVIPNQRDRQAIGVRAMLPSPELYAETVRADRELRLRGYEVYRFGGYELSRADGEALVGEFFERLFQRIGLHSFP
ncbi:MAG TPA: hypothetical protein VNO30_00810 [Kofleriaceae bacterium]|nr:hypothetical protein [Kofleriaceae bacterium]